MKNPTKKLSLLLAALMLLSCLFACATGGEDPMETTTETSATTDEGETVDAAQVALDELGEIDYEGGEIGILYMASREEEVFGLAEAVGEDGSSSQLINDAVFARNTLLENHCKLKLQYISTPDGSVQDKVQNEIAAPTGEFQLIDTYIFQNAGMATNNYLADWNEMGIDLTGDWWDRGTADFVLGDGVYFMCGSLNTWEDQTSYIMLFNKEMQKTYANTVPNPYQTVRDWEWTLDYFYEVIQGVSSDSNGDGDYNELDTYGFVTTWEYGTTLFIGSDMRYVLNDATVDMPTLYLSDSSRMEKAVDVVSMARRIYHDNNATFMSPGGEEYKGTTAFEEGRALFFGDTCMYISHFVSTMEGDYGVLPVPKYDKAQEYYRTWTHASGSSYSVASSVSPDERETLGQILQAFAIFSHQKLTPAYYDTMLTSRNLRDADSAQMLDILFQNRIYDMGLCFNELGLTEIVKTCVNDNLDNFSSSYVGATKRFDNQVKRMLNKLK